MKFHEDDIKDDEIRIISSSSEPESPDFLSRETLPRKNRRMGLIYLIVAVVVVVAGGVLWYLLRDSDFVADIYSTSNLPISTTPAGEETSPATGWTEIRDTTINDTHLLLFYPENAVPKLIVGKKALSTPGAVFVALAADVRADNGRIVGAYVNRGELLSRGESKAGFCAIIDGKLTIGVATSTPYVEQAIESGGYFFRQFPLVAGGQPVENSLQSKSLRKSLAEIDGKIAIVMTETRMTLNDFSRLLADLGASEAIYLVGSTAFGYAVDKSGRRVEFGKQVDNPPVYANYIVWEAAK